MACAVKVKRKNWKHYWFVTAFFTVSFLSCLKIFAAHFDDERKAQAFIDRNRDHNPDVIFRIEPF